MHPHWIISEIKPHDSRPEVTIRHKSGKEVTFTVPEPYSTDRDLGIEYITNQCIAHNSPIARFYVWCSALMPKAMHTSVVGPPIHYKLWSVIVAQGIIITSLLVYLGVR